MRRELLWIVPKWPFPAQDGARVATCQLLENLSRKGHTIDLLAVAGPDEKIDAEEARSKLGVRHVFAVRRKEAAMLTALLTHPEIPLTFRNYSEGSVRRSIAKILEGTFDPEVMQGSAPSHRPDWFGLVYDGLHPAIHSSHHGLFLPPKFPKNVFYRAHNFEADIWARKAERTKMLPVKAFLNYQAGRVRAFERSLLQASAGTAPVSPDDWNLLLNLAPHARGRVVPIGHDFKSEPRPVADSGELRLLFLGRLDWPPNREGLEWFLREVWSKARSRRPTLKLTIAGSGASEWLPPLIAAAPGVEFLGRVAELSSVYDPSAVSLVPIFYGSGTRVKVIEASRFGRACLSTALGVEGTGLIAGETFLRAETPEEWVKTLVELTLPRAQAMGQAAYESLRETFDTVRAAEQFERLLDECA